MIRAIICGYKPTEQEETRCIESIDMQSCRDFTTTWSLDTTQDRMYLPRNTCFAIRLAEQKGINDDDVLVFIDMDDFLCDEDAFKIITDEYKNNPHLLLTYGSYVNLSTQKRGKFTGEYLPGDSFRTSPWRASHLKTMKYRLWQYLREDMLKDKGGNWFTCCADRAIMTPLMEIAGHDRIKYIDWILYCYNDINKNSVWNTQKENSIKTREYISNQPRQPLVDII